MMGLALGTWGVTPWAGRVEAHLSEMQRKLLSADPGQNVPEGAAAAGAHFSLSLPLLSANVEIAISWPAKASLGADV